MRRASYRPIFGLPAWSALAAGLTLCLILVQGAHAATREVTLADGRSYLIELPARSAGAPMILALHGGGGNPGQMARNSGLGPQATAAGYAVIYPAGSGRTRLLTWNGGYCCGYASRQQVDDLDFLDRVIDDATRRFGLDGVRVYLTGMSNGAIMAERYAAERPERVKAVAGVAGTIDPGIRVQGPVPVLHIHGTADDSVPYEGGVGTGVTDADFNSVAATIEVFRRAGRATVGPERRVIDAEADGMRVIEEDWRDRSDRVLVRLMTIEGGGHVWPGGRRGGRSGGPRDISANEELLRFFELHP